MQTISLCPVYTSVMCLIINWNIHLFTFFTRGVIKMAGNSTVKFSSLVERLATGSLILIVSLSLVKFGQWTHCPQIAKDN